MKTSKDPEEEMVFKTLAKILTITAKRLFVAALDSCLAIKVKENREL